MIYKPTTPKLLPDHIEFAPNIAIVCPCFNDLISFDDIINGEWRDLRMREMVILWDKKIWASVGTSIFVV